MAQALTEGYKPVDAYVEAVDPKTKKSGILPKEQWAAAKAQGFTMTPWQAQRSAVSESSQQMGMNVPLNPAMQLHQQMQQTPMQAQPTTSQQVFRPQAGPSAAAQGGYFLPRYDSPEEAQEGAKQAGIGMATMGAGAGARALLPAVEGGGAGMNALRLLGRSLITGGGAATGDIATSAAVGQTPSAKEAAIVGGTGAAAELAGGTIGAGWKAVKNLFKADPAEIALAGKIPTTEEPLLQRVQQAEAQSRAANTAAYDNLKIDAAPVNVTDARMAAQGAAEELSQVASVPKAMSRVGAIPGPSIPQEISGDPQLNQIFREMTANDNIPFRQAQQYRSAIEQYISSSGGLPRNVYNSLKAVSNSLTTALRSTADKEGKLAGFETAESMFQQHAKDFWAKNAPLRNFVQQRATPAKIQPGQTGAVTNYMKGINQARALEVLDRRGIPTQDIRDLLNKDVSSSDIRNARTLLRSGRGPLDAQAKADRLAQIKKEAVSGGIKGAAGATGAGIVGGSLLALYRALKK
jgi:hypothetical protein